MLYTIDHIRAALRLPAFDGLAAQQVMMPVSRPLNRPPDMPDQARLGGVLLLLYYVEGELHLVLTRRRDDLQAHAGQISFPGGRHEAPETLLETALRETYEEIGVLPETLTVLGKLTPIYIPLSDFEVHAFVAWHKEGRPEFAPDPREVAEIVEVPLNLLLEPATRQEEARLIRDLDLIVPYFAVEQHKVWGATAIMLGEFLERLRAVVR